MEALPSLPFRIAGHHLVHEGGVTVSAAYQLHGLLRVEGGDLVIDTRWVGHEGASEVETHRVPVADVSEVEYRSGMFRTRLVLRPRRLAAFEDVPSASPESLVLPIARADRALASRWATTLSLALLDRDGFDDDLASRP
jgi:hypothetical protein